MSTTTFQIVKNLFQKSSKGRLIHTQAFCIELFFYEESIVGFAEALGLNRRKENANSPNSYAIF
jgi:hypothetical protein